MGAITESELKSDIKSGNFSKIYFIYGKETLICQQYAGLIAKKSVLQLSDFNLFKLNGNDHTVQNVIDSVNQFPMMSEKKCVIACDFDIVKMTAEDKKEMLNLIENPFDHNVLVFWFDSVKLYQTSPDGSYKKYLEPKWSEIIKLAGKNGKTIEIEPLSEHSLQNQIVNAAAKRGKTIDRDAAYLLINLTGKNMLIISGELDKLAAFTEEARITRQDVEDVVSGSFENNIYKIMNAINNGKIKDALDEINNLLAFKVRPEIILGTMAGDYITAYYVHLLKKSGKNYNEIKSILKIPKNQAFKVDASERLLFKLGEKRVKKIINLFNDTDRKIKSYNLDKKLLLEKLCGEIALCMAD